jgi:hypothetical protein
MGAVGDSEHPASCLPEICVISVTSRRRHMTQITLVFRIPFSHGIKRSLGVSALRGADYRSKTITDALHMVQLLKRYGREF